MRSIYVTIGGIAAVYGQLERVPYAVLAIPLRIAVATVFWNSAMTKLADWNAALFLFTDEYENLDHGGHAEKHDRRTRPRQIATVPPRSA